MAKRTATTTLQRGAALSNMRGQFGLQVPRDRSLPAGVTWIVAMPEPEQSTYELEGGRVWQRMVPPPDTVQLNIESCTEAELVQVLFALAAVATQNYMELSHYHYGPDPRQHTPEWEVSYRVEPGIVMRWDGQTWQVLQPPVSR